MRVLFAASTDGGGAGTAAWRCFRAVKEAGVDARMRVQFRDRKDSTISVQRGSELRKLIWPRVERGVARLLHKKRPNTLFSPGFLPSVDRFVPKGFEPDLLHLNWIADAFVHPGRLVELGMPIIWTLHDMWPFTGGCHYSSTCQRFEGRCGACPQLSSSSEWDLSRFAWIAKQRAYSKLDITLIAPSRWIEVAAQRSELFRGVSVRRIPYAMDLDTYRPRDRMVARDVLGLPQGIELILVGAADLSGDLRKGYDLLEAAWKPIASCRARAKLVAFGREPEANDPEFLLSLGTLKDEVTAALAYSAADVFVAPSREDNLPQTVVEALCCGTPVVGFEIGGMPDLILPGETGFLARPFETDALAKAILCALSSVREHDQMAKACRAKAEREYSMRGVGKQYLEVYQEVLSRYPSRDTRDR